MIDTDIGGLLRTHRQRTGMTQRQLADLAGLSLSVIRDLEQGRTRIPKRESVQAIASALGLTEADVAILHAGAGIRQVARHGVTAIGSGPLRIRVLGPIEVWHGDVLAPLGSDRQRTLLARLALAAGAAVAQDELVELLWRPGESRDAVSLLHTHVTRLRRLLDSSARSGSVLVGGQKEYRLVVGADNLDLLAFRELTTPTANGGPEVAFARLADAVALWRGDLDADRVASSPLYAAAVSDYAAAVRSLAGLARDLGKPDEVLTPLRALARRYELDEPLHVELILTLAASGRQAEALAAYDQIRGALAQQLGIDPGEALRSVQLAVLRRQDWRRRPGAGPIAVQQTPAAPPDFIGRSGELTRVEAALARPADGRGPAAGRIVLIDGIAGVGKTALALAAAQRLRGQYPDGQLYADLRGATETAPEPMQVLGRFLRALGVPSRQIGIDQAEAAALLRSELADRRMLILLDNVHDADQVRPLLPGAGGSDVIVTSRRRMHGLAGAVVVDLGPLAQEESVALIAATAGSQRVDADPAAASELAEACARLPLALRIASARLATRQAWTISDLTRRLGDENHRLAELSTDGSSVLNSFQLSYADLSASAQRAFRLCSLHPGDDFGADGTAVLLGLRPAEADRLLENLLEANMVMQYAPDRYRFHDLLGLYARRLLTDDGEADAARARLYAWYAETATAAMEWAYPQLVRLAGHPKRDAFFAAETDALSWLDVELPALLTVVGATAGSADPSLSWRITDQLRGYFLIRRHVDGWLDAAQAGLGAATKAGNDIARTAMLISRGQALWSVGRDDEALADCLAGEQLAFSTGWTTAAAYLSHHIGWLHLEHGRLAGARRWLDRALELTEYDQAGHVRAVALNALGVMNLDQGRLRDAAALLTSALEINETHGRELSALANRGNLASALRQAGEETRAAALLTGVLAEYRKKSNLRGELSTLDEWSSLHLQRGDAVTALQVATRAHEPATTVRDRKATAQTAATVAHTYLALGDATAARQWFDDSLAIARKVYPFIEARALVGLAAARLTAGDSLSATRAAEEALSIAGACGFDLLAQKASAVLHDAVSGTSRAAGPGRPPSRRPSPDSS
ncbi:DNA-binding SARP family transcriptional activator [Kribbella amoyensis]|uniref:DNA-binding SARP family transcriptional activator n=1 Tax=Kribbella amoyensis TaxID=996641 RepID=A0A561BXT6_9ACTN|nr:BTAD domain-containing putative transcriptional regulator [Kribbella amoyensis]TWD83706.1 DNA-binding SARP family transcriptional activator [Kribbella amoyensis]